MVKLKIQREEHGKKGAFFVEKDGKWIAEMTYRREGARTLVIDHTAIAKQLQGKGVGKAMVKAAVKYAEKNNLLIKPACPFVKKVLESSEEYEDILAR
jgi:predicted GNAT family acetyltransferase